MTGTRLTVALLAGFAMTPQLGGTLRQDGHAKNPRRTDADQESIRGFHFYIGRWLAPGDDPQAGLEFSWGIEEKSVHIRELRRIGGRLQPVSSALAGWHYGRQEIQFTEFVRGSRGSEVMYTGSIWFEPGDVLYRRFEAFHPDGSSGVYRERFEPEGIDAWIRSVEFLDDEGRWKAWGSFKGHAQRDR